MKENGSATPDHPGQHFSWSSLWFVVLTAVFVRIVNALLIRTQFDPDEYWQTLEPAYCMAFQTHGYSCHLTWEWTRRALSSVRPSSLMVQLLHGPVRSYVSILPTYWFYATVQRFGWDFPWMISKGPLVLHAVLVAAPVDVSIWIAAHFISSPVSNVPSSKIANLSFFFSLTSWFQGYALVRTYSNSFETMLLMVGVALVSPELLSNAKGLQYQYIRSSLAFVLGGISVAVRFSSLGTWIPLGILLAVQQHPSSHFYQLLYLAIPCEAFALLGIGLTLLIDWMFYGFWVAPFLANFHFNAVLGMGSLYGTHPFYWYLSAGIPAITGLLFPLLLMNVSSILFGSNRHQSRPQNNLWIIVVSYTAILSLSSHKEFRFLLPILPLLFLLAASQWAVQESKLRSNRFLRRVFVLANAAALIYLGLIHQRAPLDVNQRIVQLIQERHRLGSGNVTTMTTTVHYLMGCHSTPLYSHLHVPSARVVAKTLDCSPDCRADPNQICVSDAFELNPRAFVKNMYQRNRTTTTTTALAGSSSSSCWNMSDSECVDPPLRDAEDEERYPDFVVVNSRHSALLRPRLKTMGLVEIHRFFYSINGLTLVAPQRRSASATTDDDHRRVKILDVLEVTLEEIVLFSSSKHHQNQNA